MTKTQRGLAVFLFMAFVPVWACDIFMSEDNPLYWYTALFCSLGGFAASYAEGGLDGLRAFGRRTLRVAGSLRFIVIGYLIPLGLGLGWMALRAAGKLPSAFHPAFDAGFLAMLATAWITGPFAEEFGWRGYLQNTLLTRMSPFLTALVVALIWAVWHLPAFYDSVFSSLRSTLGFASHCLTLSLLLVWLVATLIFGVLRLVPGDPAEMLLSSGGSDWIAGSGKAEKVEGGYRINADGTGLTKLFSYRQMAALFGKDGSELNRNVSFRDKLAISANGLRMVFGTYNFQPAGNAIVWDSVTGLRKLTDFAGLSDDTIAFSSDGSKVTIVRRFADRTSAIGLHA